MKLKKRLKGWLNKMTEKKEKKKKVQHREMKECPYCHNHYGNVTNHIRDSHPTEAAADGRKVGTEITKESLLGKEPPPPPKPEDKVYYCNDCRARLRKGESPCWKCGKPLNWGGL